MKKSIEDVARELVADGMGNPFRDKSTGRYSSGNTGGMTAPVGGEPVNFGGGAIAATTAKVEAALATKVNTVVTASNGSGYLVRKGQEDQPRGWGGKMPNTVEVYAHGHSANNFIGRAPNAGGAAKMIEEHALSAISPAALLNSRRLASTSRPQNTVQQRNFQARVAQRYPK